MRTATAFLPFPPYLSYSGFSAVGRGPEQEVIAVDFSDATVEKIGEPPMQDSAILSPFIMI